MKMGMRILDDPFQLDREREEYAKMADILTRHGYTFIYGGGSRQKGHGFWIQKDGETVQHSDCEKYGNLNPNFWTHAALADKFED